MPHAVRPSPGTRGGCRDALLARGGLRNKRVLGNAHAAPRALGGRPVALGPVSVGGVVAVVRLYVHRRALLPLRPRVRHPAHAGPRGNGAGIAVGDQGVRGVCGQGGRSYGDAAPRVGGLCGGVHGGDGLVAAAGGGAVVLRGAVAACDGGGDGVHPEA